MLRHWETVCTQDEALFSLIGGKYQDETSRSSRPSKHQRLMRREDGGIWHKTSPAKREDFKKIVGIIRLENVNDDFLRFTNAVTHLWDSEIMTTTRNVPALDDDVQDQNPYQGVEYVQLLYEESQQDVPRPSLPPVRAGESPAVGLGGTRGTGDVSLGNEAGDVCRGFCGNSTKEEYAIGPLGPGGCFTREQLREIEYQLDIIHRMGGTRWG